jgi:hypothetical protein
MLTSFNEPTQNVILLLSRTDPRITHCPRLAR